MRPPCRYEFPAVHSHGALTPVVMTRLSTAPIHIGKTERMPLLKRMLFVVAVSC